MKFSYSILILLIGLCFCSLRCTGQKPFGSEYLTLDKVISLPNVKGRIDHMDVNLKDQIVYMAALGNNSLEAIDLKTGKIIHSVKGLDEPQGVGYIPQQHEIFVANGRSGDCYFYNATTFEKTGTIHLSSDADDVRYDSIEKKIYVGYGDGGIAIIDSDTRKLSGDIKLPAHPEGFQIDKAPGKMYVNLPDAHIIGVVDLKQMKLIDKWPNNNLAANFPMAIDTLRHQVFIGFRRPATLVVMNAKYGKELNRSAIVGDTDDLYYDPTSNKVYISGGSGAVYIYAQDGNGFKQIANIPTRNGARTSLLIPALRLFVVAARSGINQAAELIVYKIPG